ncbi:MAG: suppressor of fused domain protein [Brumimicrobium sp.]|nr:suppressor of fused domain protein [Brumimicrobium sp.]
MSELLKVLKERLGEHRVRSERRASDYIDLLIIDLETTVPVTVVMTHGLSDYKMPVPDTMKGKDHTEIFFALPSYWEPEDHQNQNMTWPFEKISKLAENLIEKGTWYGRGHTFSNGNPSLPLSSTMKMNHLMLAEPIALEQFFRPIELEDKIVHFLAIIPLFEEEFDRKMQQGYKKFIRKFRSANGDEILDDFRQSVLKSRWRIWG